MPCYRVHRLGSLMEPQGWSTANDPPWDQAEVAEISCFHPRSSDHHPRTQVRLVHDDRQLFVRFDVQDRYVLAAASRFQDPVCLDSCVEFFFRPRPDAGYFNVEINCGGTLLMSYIRDPRRTEDGFAHWQPVAWEDACKIEIHHSLPARVLPERQEPTNWHIAYRLPLEALEPYVGTIGSLGGQCWVGNFFKCADRSSHPHWASWSPLGEALNFHMPEYFAPIHFDV